ncbi:MAG: glycosyltransferase family A protein, partial [Ornithinimicrobium sp.]
MSTVLPTVSIVLPMHRTGDEAQGCLAALAALSPAPREIIIVVDGAAPEVMELARPHATRLIPLRRQGGPARARNRGAVAATSDVLLFIDADVVVQHDIVARVQG